MMPNTNADISSSQQRVVLVLQAEQALWFKWLDGELLDSFIEPISTHPLKMGTLCPWLGAEQDFGGFQIELILDSALDELDKVKSDATEKIGFHRLKRWQLERRMLQDYPHSAIHALPAYMVPDVLSIHHQVIPDSWCLWLQRLQENNVVVTHVVTATELLTRLQYVVDGPVLFVMPVGAENRHLLVDKSSPLFMRMVCEINSDNDVVEYSPVDTEGAQSNTFNGAIAELNNTLEYVSSTVLKGDCAISVFAPLNDGEASPSVVNSAGILATLCVNLPVEFSVTRWSEGALSETPLNSATVHLPCGDWLVLRILRQLFELVPWPLAALTSSSLNPCFNITGKRRRSTQALVSSVNSSALRQRINALRNATVLSALMATITVVLAGVQGVHSARERASLASQGEQVEEKILPLSSAVDSLHHSPEFAFSSLQRMKVHQSIKPLETRILLSTIAGAITDFPSLKLDSLSWSVIDEGDTSYDEISVNSRMIGRSTLWTGDARRSQIHIELSGVVSSKQGLREQQAAVTSFVIYLEAVEGVSRVSVLESPAQVAKSSQVLVDMGARYRLSLILGAS